MKDVEAVAGSAVPEQVRESESLVRGLGAFEATTLVVGGIIGSGIFLAPSLVAGHVGAPGLALGVWLLAGIVATCGALCYAELAGAIPKTGGTYQFLKTGYGHPLIPFLFGWTMTVGFTTAIAAVATAFASYAGYFLESFLPWGPWGVRSTAVGCILFLTTLNYLGVRLGGRTQNLMTVLKVGGLALLVVVGLAFGGGSAAHFLPLMPDQPPESGTLIAFGTAMIPAVFAYNGWTFSTYVAGEVRDPARNVPRSIIAGIGIVILVYVLVNVTYMYTLPFERLQSSTLVAADSMVAAIGPTGGAVISAVVMISTFGASNAQILAYPRVSYALSKDGYFFSWFDHVHPRYHTPHNAILAQGIVASLFALSGTYEDILTYFAFVDYAFFALAVSAVVILRVRAPDLPRPYRVWGYPFTPLVFLVVIVWYLQNMIVHRFEDAVVGVLFLLLGLPLYLRRSRQRRGRAGGTP